ncbi:MAG TPA: methionyl-tRNA formyltransferase [Candidatus Binataceae bacterium]|nr:methionyl-tRNA formyltransferase [Candidatus Binataceae bacterium]
MRIALIGQAAFAERALETLHARGDEIVHVFAPPDAPGGRPDPLKVKAAAMGLPLSQPATFKSDEAWEQFRALDADLLVMAFVTLIVPERILYAPRFKSICFHPSLLPRHRGASAINWTLIMGDTHAGVTWFWPDKGIDTGPILVQRAEPIRDEDTVGSLYFNRLFPMGIETLGQALKLIESGRPPAIAQDESRATYEPPCRDEHAKVDFAREARAVFNLVRGCDPQPGAFAELGGGRLRLYEPVLENRKSGSPPGTIVSIDTTGMRIALKDATMLVRRVRFDTSPKKVAPQELALSGHLQVSSHLG